MKKAKLSLILLTMIFALGISLIPNLSKAYETLETKLTLGINYNMPGSEIGYAIGVPGSGTGMKIWDIVEKNGTQSINTSKSYYCIKAGVGFTNNSNAVELTDDYTIKYNFRKEKDAILNLKVAGKTMITEENYYNLLALTDLLYLGDGLSDKEKVDTANKLLLDAGIDVNDDLGYTIFLTPSQIEAIQQAAIWYFTNSDEDMYNNLEKENWLNYSLNNKDYNMIINYNKEGIQDAGYQLNEQANMLYEYLINTAIDRAKNYSDEKAKTKIDLYLNSTNSVQPIILIEKDEKIFDLALRKYITKVDGNNVENTRIPNIDISTIDTQGTATYKHRKDPVAIEKGSIVTYNISIYNEGDKSGYATKIIDQLPTGLELNDGINATVITSTKGTKYTVNYDIQKNQISFTVLDENKDSAKNINAYSDTLDSDTITFDCKVTARASTENNQILTNVAWIAEEYDAIDNKIIKAQKGADRDSEPETMPNVNKDNMANYIGLSTNKTDLTDSANHYKGQQDDDDFEKLILKKKIFDLKLIKRITAVNGEKIDNRILNVDITSLANGTSTTATYKLEKNPLSVRTGDIVEYTFRIYNEGEIDGYASEITENIPDGLEFLWQNPEKTYSQEEQKAIDKNIQLGWTFADSTMKTIKTDYLAKGKGAEIKEDEANLIKAFNPDKQYTDKVNDKNPDYKEVSVFLKVVSTNYSQIIRNEAAITKNTDYEGKDVTDRDSSVNKWGKEDSDKYYDENKKWPIYKEDDEDYDNIILQQFDLALRKYIVAVSNDETINEKEYFTSREPSVDTSKLNEKDQNGNIITTTATYNHSKKPVEVNKGDYVVYRLKVYNEGDIAGYASEITDYLPKYLEFIPSNTINKNYGWIMYDKDGNATNDVEKAVKIKTTYLKDKLIAAAKFNEDKKGQRDQYTLSTQYVEVVCKVKNIAEYNKNITNIAEITESKDKEGNRVTDRDSETNNVNIPEEKDLPEYKSKETGSYIPGQQDDDDFEKLVIKPFDLALRKFITGVNDKEVTTRIPQVKYDNESGIKYEHAKEPVDVVKGDKVIYTIRVYNEGEVAGYAEKITDDIPDGLKFLPDDEINKSYGWVMYDKDGKVTEDVTKAVKITTDFLSKANGTESDKIDEETGLKTNSNLLHSFNKDKAVSETNPDYKDVKVAFEVIEPNGSDKIIINSAQISDDKDYKGNDIDDIDSIPDKWNDGEDDQDQEKIKLTYFDLALRKWVTQAIVIENGKETITQTGHKAEDDPEEVVKVEIHRKKINSVTVKFRYSIRVTNEGDIAGYAKEITDYVPEGLKFVAEDNKDWVDEGNNVISTRLLENTLLKPGESAEIEVLLTWINGNNNLGLKTNIAEISEDYNDKNVPDRDSIPDNQIPGEDDIDDAPVLLSVSTGQIRIYYTLGFIVLITLAGGIIIIKKYVL